MAGIIATATTAEVALTAATAKTVLQVICAANHMIKIKAWSVFFDGVSVTAEPVQVRLLRQTNNGTGTTNTPRLTNPLITATLQTTAKDTYTVEPTAGNVIDTIEVHPQTGFRDVLPFGDEYYVGGTGSADAIGIECTAPAGVNVRAVIKFEE
jgi:hypothetical protein